MKKFRFVITTVIDLAPSEMWIEPPEDPSVKDVVARVKACGGSRQVTNDWNLLRKELIMEISDGIETEVAE